MTQFSKATRDAKMREALGIVDIAKDLQSAIEQNYVRMPHADFNRLIWPIISDSSGRADMSIVSKVAGNPSAPIIVVDAGGAELYRMPALWNTRNLENRPKTRSQSMTVLAQDAAMRAHSGTIPPSEADSYVVSKIQHLIHDVKVSDVDLENWKLVVQYNTTGVPAQVAKTSTANQSMKVELDGNYEDL